VELKVLLKHKGIGKKGSKSLTEQEVKVLREIIYHQKPNIITLATMLTAILMLDANTYETQLISSLKQDYKIILPRSLHFLFKKSEDEFTQLCSKIIQHQDLSEKEAFTAVDYLFDTNILPEHKAIFLESERLKRETYKENKTFFQAFDNQVNTVKISVTDLLQLCDSYDGCVRINPITIFICPILAALGLSVYMTGLKQVAPKNGVTAHQQLLALGKNPSLSIAESKTELETVGWTYIDQSQFFPKLHNLLNLREKMVKRPFLATFEKILPVFEANKNYCYTSYTHKAYRNQVVELLRDTNYYNRIVNVKGVEATTKPFMNRETNYVFI